MKPGYLIFILLCVCGCATKPAQNASRSFLSVIDLHNTPESYFRYQPVTRQMLFQASSRAQAEDVAPPMPLVLQPVTLRVGFTGLDEASEYPEAWTNAWSCEALLSMDVTKPLAEWDRVPATLTIYQGELAMEITSNAPWLQVAAEYHRK